MMLLSPHFSMEELVCPCCQQIKCVPWLNAHLLLLEMIREELSDIAEREIPININSGYRCEEHNERIGGSTGSWHMEFATDWWPDDLELLPEASRLAVELGFTGVKRYGAFIHSDMRNKDPWIINVPGHEDTE